MHTSWKQNALSWRSHIVLYIDFHPSLFIIRMWMSVGSVVPSSSCEDAGRSLITAVLMLEDGLGEVRRGPSQSDTVICITALCSKSSCSKLACCRSTIWGLKQHNSSLEC